MRNPPPLRQIFLSGRGMNVPTTRIVSILFSHNFSIIGEKHEYL